jgi:hypothetical protein
LLAATFAARNLRAEVPPFVESWVILFLHRPSLPCLRRQIILKARDGDGSE